MKRCGKTHLLGGLQHLNDLYDLQEYFFNFDHMLNYIEMLESAELKQDWYLIDRKTEKWKTAKQKLDKVVLLYYKI